MNKYFGRYSVCMRRAMRNAVPERSSPYVCILPGSRKHPCSKKGVGSLDSRTRSLQPPTSMEAGKQPARQTYWKRLKISETNLG